MKIYVNGYTVLTVAMIGLFGAVITAIRHS